MSISIVDNLIERCPETDDESDILVEARDPRYSCLIISFLWILIIDKETFCKKTKQYIFFQTGLDSSIVSSS